MIEARVQCKRHGSKRRTYVVCATCPKCYRVLEVETSAPELVERTKANVVANAMNHRCAPLSEKRRIQAAIRARRRAVLQ